MSCILIAWELGSNYGHLARCLPIAEGLRQRGHRLVFVVRDTRAAAELLGPAGFSFLQAPLAVNKTRLARPASNYAEILLGEGYADPLGLLGIVRAWQGLLELSRADLVLADHAPTALLAAHLAGIAHLAIGNGFAIPPDVSPLPSIRPWESIPEARLLHAGQSVDAAMFGVAEKLGFRGASGLRDLFCKDDLLDTFAELDHYGVREGANYIGPIFSLAGAQQVAWQEAQSKKVVAYLRPDIPGFSALMTALNELDAEKLCVIPGLRPEHARRWFNRRLRIAFKPVVLTDLLNGADIAISYGGGGTMSEALLAGTPLLLVPRFVEQYLAARPVENLGAGILVGNDRSKAFFAGRLRTLLDDSRYAGCARKFAGKYAGFAPQQAVARAIVAIEGCVSKKTVARPTALNG
jgi:UDP:flavonoid glycosyltransferase YjiC (YdhE family)